MPRLCEEPRHCAESEKTKSPQNSNRRKLSHSRCFCVWWKTEKLN